MTSSGRPLAVLVAGDPIPTVREKRGGWASVIRAAADGWRGPWLEVDLRSSEPLPEPAALAGLIVTGSSSSVSDREAWVLRGEDYLERAVAAGAPVLGICFGHQMLGQALGGEVARSPRGREIGTVELHILEDDPLFVGAAPPALVQATHVDGVARLPSAARVIARTALEPHAAVRFGPRAWGVQFHPEIDADIMREYLLARREIIASEGLDPEALLAGVRDARAGGAVIPRFVEQIRGSR